MIEQCRKIARLAAHFGVEYRRVDYIPMGIEGAPGDCAHVGRIIWMADDDPPHWIHELSHWLVATPERRRGINYATHDDDCNPQFDEDAVCNLDVYLLERLFDREMSAQWWYVIHGDGSYEQMHDNGRRLWRRITGRKGPGRMLADKPLTGLPLEFAHHWGVDDDRSEFIRAWADDAGR